MKVCDRNNIILYFNYMCFCKFDTYFEKIVKEIFSPLTIQSTMFTLGSTNVYVYIKTFWLSHKVYLYAR